MLGSSPINSFTEGSQANGLDTARLCSNLWPTTRDAILRSHPWKCAKARVKLSPEATAPAFGYTKRFILPSNWLRNVEINGVVAEEVDYEVETADSNNPSKRLLLSQDALNLVYIWENIDTESWDAMLVKAAEYAMAAEMAYAVAQSTSLKDLFEGKLRAYLAQCRAVDSQDQSPAQFGSLEVLGARRSLTYNY